MNKVKLDVARDKTKKYRKEIVKHHYPTLN